MPELQHNQNGSPLWGDVDPYTASPEDLHELRATVEAWLRKAEDAVWSLKRQDGSFRRDSDAPDSSSITTTARCYMALACAEHRLGYSADGMRPGWRLSFRKYLPNIPIIPAGEGFKETDQHGKECDDLNNFELAHLADFAFVRAFLQKFGDRGSAPCWPEDGKGVAYEDHLLKSLRPRIVNEGAGPNGLTHEKGGQLFFDLGDDLSKHFFVTLHTLRALAILAPQEEQRYADVHRLAGEAEQFCVRQCFYCQRDIRHRQDPARLAFAGVIYCMYSYEPDDHVINAVVEALAAMQEPNGKWPTTHPIIRGATGQQGKRRDPWYIASQEIALSLTWLYFQPRLPDAARRVLLAMLETHYRGWILPTYRRVSEEQDSGSQSEQRGGQSDHDQICGWYDDSATGHDGLVVGWATAIVCHFLANYLKVLDDHINRRVIESLGLHSFSNWYLIDETSPKQNPRWEMKSGPVRARSIWPDLPPISWSAERRDIYDLAREISWRWTDPTYGAEISEKLGRHVLAPISDGVQQWPGRYIAGILDGPPGTRKTSLVMAIAMILKWPYVPVPASVVFDRGFDHMEARASEVFRRLNYLTQCVIFFDEFEEFFRSRADEDREVGDGNQRGFSIHDRTIAAFTTSAMLPRLQELRDQGRSLIFLATNHFEKIDEAIVRSGRFDYRETIEHPTVARFKGDDKGYFAKPTKRFLESLGIKVDKNKKFEPDDSAKPKLKSLSAALESALDDKLVRCLLGKAELQTRFRFSRRDAPADLHLSFRIVERAANEMAKVFDKGEDIAGLARKATDELAKILDEELRNSSGKGPGELPTAGVAE